MKQPKWRRTLRAFLLAASVCAIPVTVIAFSPLLSKFLPGYICDNIGGIAFYACPLCLLACIALGFRRGMTKRQIRRHVLLILLVLAALTAFQIFAYFTAQATKSSHLAGAYSGEPHDTMRNGLAAVEIIS